MPVGTIDPILKSVGFFQGDRPLARLYYYTTHPMSYYGDGRVSSDFAGNLPATSGSADEPRHPPPLFYRCGRQRHRAVNTTTATTPTEPRSPAGSMRR